MSRIIVKNIPNSISEKDLKSHFSLKGEITDIKIMKNRQFAFIGFKQEDQALESIKYYNNTYVWTSRISVEPAKVQGDEALNKPWLKKSTSKDVKKKDAAAHNSKENKIQKLLDIVKSSSTKNKFDQAEIELYSKKKPVPEEKKDVKNGEILEKTVSKNNRPDSNIDPKRLYLMNLPFMIADDELKSVFGKFGEINEIFIPKDFKSINKGGLGYAYISYQTVESAILALSAMDKSVFQGRILHISPAQIKKTDSSKTPYLNNTIPEKSKKSDYKTKKSLKNKMNYDDETNWNYLFMNQNAVITNISNKLNIDKSQLLDRDSSNLAVNVATMETHIINETKDWLVENGLDFDSLKGKRAGCIRSKTTILVKNISPNVNREKLEELFSRYGVLMKFLIAPSKCFAVADFVDEKHAKNCIKNLSYHEIDSLPLYLEFAPEGLIRKENNETISKQENSSISNKIPDDTINLSENEGKIVFIMNLNFKTKEETLKVFFSKNNLNPVKVKIITHKKKDSILSSGYGFVEFKTSIECENCIKKLQGQIIDDHSIKLSIAKSKDKNNLLGNKRKQETNLNDFEFISENVEDNKILVKNIAFEATREEIRALFKGYGEIKNVRLPQKLDGQHRGFCFIEFLTHDEAKNAFKKLQNTHFYGRKLVFEWAQKEKTIEDLRENTKRKMDVRNIEMNSTFKKAAFDVKNFK